MSRRLTIKAGLFVAIVAMGLAKPAHASATEFICGPGACISACEDAEAACQSGSPNCHATAQECYFDANCGTFLAADCEQIP